MAAVRKTSYSAADIQVLEGLEPVRKRPAMYIGGTDATGYHHLLWEILDNSVDEVINGYASRIEVTLHKDGKTVTVADDGKELPVGPGRFHVTSRGGKGHALKRKTKIARVTPAEPLAPPAAPTLLN